MELSKKTNTKYKIQIKVRKQKLCWNLSKKFAGKFVIEWEKNRNALWLSCLWIKLQSCNTISIQTTVKNLMRSAKTCLPIGNTFNGSEMLSFFFHHTFERLWNQIKSCRGAKSWGTMDFSLFFVFISIQFWLNFCWLNWFFCMLVKKKRLLKKT